VGCGIRRTRQCGGGAVRRCRAGMNAGEVRGVWSHRERRVACIASACGGLRQRQGQSTYHCFVYIQQSARYMYVAVAQWSRCCPNAVEVAGSDPNISAVPFFLKTVRAAFFCGACGGQRRAKANQQGTFPQTPAPMAGLQRASCVVCSFVRPLATAMCSELAGRPCARVATGACHSTPACVHTSKAKRPRPRACSCAGLECQIPLKIQRKGSSGAQKGACS
jgi:hypothetical protein